MSRPKTASDKELRSALGDEAFAKLKRFLSSDEVSEASLSDSSEELSYESIPVPVVKKRVPVPVPAVKKKVSVPVPAVKKKAPVTPVENDKYKKEPHDDAPHPAAKTKLGIGRRIPITNELIAEVVRLRSERHTIASIRAITKLSERNVSKILRDHAHHAIRN